MMFDMHHIELFNGTIVQGCEHPCQRQPGKYSQVMQALSVSIRSLFCNTQILPQYFFPLRNV